MKTFFFLLSFLFLVVVESNQKPNADKRELNADKEDPNADIITVLKQLSARIVGLDNKVRQLYIGKGISGKKTFLFT